MPHSNNHQTTADHTECPSTSHHTRLLAQADADIFRSAILSSVKSAIEDCPISASGDINISARTRAFASFLSGYLECSTPELSEAIFSLFKKD